MADPVLPVFRINADFSIFQKFRTLRTSQKNPRAEIFFFIKMWKLGRSLAKKANLCQRVYIRLGETRLARLARPVTLVGWKRPRLSLRSLAISSRHLIYDRNLAKFKRKQRRTNKLAYRNETDFPAGRWLSLLRSFVLFSSLDQIVLWFSKFDVLESFKFQLPMLGAGGWFIDIQNHCVVKYSWSVWSCVVCVYWDWLKNKGSPETKYVLTNQPDLI